ncbi:MULTISPECIES: hypothetical protein [unclassified Bradyrhizobium]|uniref:hypothetical protein n=1 Tax=unclassified Bradyrhizobium TaxID=2631580 RepID=UPI0003FD76EC|nr:MULTISPECIES: hypothetical protein [unclassified Bradyrhizobium]QIG98770.1 hypothetical protein G6P99_45665 [Bradyrhizobium sp. 6(2017)]
MDNRNEAARKPFALTRRMFLTSLSASFLPGALSVLGSGQSAAAPVPHRPLVGAIRWDAWYSPGSQPTEAVKQSLAPERYRWRTPFFGTQVNRAPNTLDFPTSIENEMDKEIDQAIFAGLDYWAFAAYGANHPMSKALYEFRARPKAANLRYCMFTELGRWGSLAKLSSLPHEHIGLMADKNYLKVENDRPLYFLGFIKGADVQRSWGGVEGLRSQLSKFKSDANGAGLADPYIVLAGDMKFLSQEAANVGADAVGSYALTTGNGRGSFADLAKYAEKGWNDLAASQLPVVPTVMTGWDRRPRIEHPVPWETKQRPGDGITNFYTAPTKKELAGHLAQSISWVNSRAPDRRAPAVLIYAWNENDEGGWLVPTMPCQTDRLEALREVLKATAQSSSKNLC